MEERIGSLVIGYMRFRWQKTNHRLVEQPIGNRKKAAYGLFYITYDLLLDGEVDLDRSCCAHFCHGFLQIADTYISPNRKRAGAALTFSSGHVRSERRGKSVPKRLGGQQAEFGAFQEQSHRPLRSPSSQSVVANNEGRGKERS